MRRWTFIAAAAWSAWLFSALSSGAGPGLVGIDPSFPGTPGSQEWRWYGVPRVVAIGDVHGAFRDLIELLTAAQLIGEDLKWSGQTAHLVLTGDLIDRGPGGRAILDFVMGLEREAAEAGGKVHVLLGNHEVMGMAGDLRFASPDDLFSYAAQEPAKVREAAFQRFLEKDDTRHLSREEARRRFDLRYPRGYFGHRALFSPTGVYGKWLLNRPALIVINGTAFVHGGLSPIVEVLGGENLNRRIKDELEEYLFCRDVLENAGVLFPETTPQEALTLLATALAGQQANGAQAAPVPPAALDSARRMLALSQAVVFRADGPMWYRGTVLNPEKDEEPLVRSVLARLGARQVVVGHTATADGRIAVRLGGLVVRIETGFWRHDSTGKPAFLEIRGEKVEAHYPREGLQGPPKPETIGSHEEDWLEGILPDRETGGLFQAA